MADLKNERATELAAIERIVTALEEIINDEGVHSYSIQQNSIDMSRMVDEELKK
mgnify:FL=1